MNPMQLISMFASGGKSAKDVVMELTKNNNNPVINNLVKMAEQGDTKGVENFARNMFKEQGRDFDSELKNIQQMFPNFK